ncbi:unnamed protein product [Cuscuta europaea]|uniref:Uncharacterized protein n=1 Tax=Cuscuta europaea TaxID=41803 RepID=A0A9P1E016_CUSEU|nr:unnamed protein product [Cuscuta europaea]
MRSKPSILDTIIGILTTNYHGPWYSFKHADESQRERWWTLFQNKYEWDPYIHKRIKKRFESRASSWLSKNLGRARRKDEKPEWISKEHWAVLKEYWGSDEFKKKSVAGKKNRSTEAARGSQFRGGRIPVTTHVQRMTESLKRTPLKIEVFEKVYVPKAGDPPPRVIETR